MPITVLWLRGPAGPAGDGDPIELPIAQSDVTGLVAALATQELRRGWVMIAEDAEVGLTTGTQGTIAMDSAGTLKRVVMTALDTATRPIGASVIINILKVDSDDVATTIFTTPTRPTLPVATLSAEFTEFVDDAHVAGDRYRLDIIQAGSTFGGDVIDVRMIFDEEVS